MDKNFNDVYRTDMAVTVDEAGFKETKMVEYGREKTVFIADGDNAADWGGSDTETSPDAGVSQVSLEGYLKENDADLKYIPITAPVTTSLSDSDIVVIRSADGTFKTVSLAVLKEFLLA